MQRAELLERVKQAVHEVEPEADIVLYGSRARGNAWAYVRAHRDEVEQQIRANEAA